MAGRDFRDLRDFRDSRDSRSHRQSVGGIGTKPSSPAATMDAHGHADAADDDQGCGQGRVRGADARARKHGGPAGSTARGGHRHDHRRDDGDPGVCGIAQRAGGIIGRSNNRGGGGVRTSAIGGGRGTGRTGGGIRRIGGIGGIIRGRGGAVGDLADPGLILVREARGGVALVPDAVGVLIRLPPVVDVGAIVRFPRGLITVIGDHDRGGRHRADPVGLSRAHPDNALELVGEGMLDRGRGGGLVVGAVAVEVPLVGDDLAARGV